MEALGREMIRHCGGLPLAILVLGGILVTKRSLPAWESVHKSINTSLKADRGIGEDHEKEVLEILEWSYIYLPYQLKLCFLYLGQFPEDADIEAEKLYQMWMAEGLLLQKDRRDGETMLDVAESYLAELAHKSMIGLEMEEYESSIRKFSSCRLRDLMRDLSRRKAEEEDFFSELDIRHGLQLQQSAESSSRRDHFTRRVVIVDKLKFTDGSEAVASKSKRVDINECLCSMILLDKYEHVDILVRFLRRNMNNFKFLRVLSLENLSNGSFEIQGVSQLTNLRYLSFRESRLVKLPVINSKHLQTLDLRVLGGMDLSSMNNMRHDLRCLRHLYLSENLSDSVETRNGLVGANNLANNIRNWETWRVDEGAMPNLTSLYIENCPTLEKLPDGLRFLTSLRELVIEGMPEEFKNRLKEGGEDFYNIPPLASVKFRISLPLPLI